MKVDLANIALLAIAFLVLFTSGEYLYRVRKVKGELTRKWVHFGTGALTLLFPLLLSSHWSVLILCSAFALILMLSLQVDFLPSINAIERISYGSLCYPLAVYVVFVLYERSMMKGNWEGGMLTWFYMPILILAISDPLAALVGSRTGWKPFKIWNSKKTLAGSLTFFISAWILTSVLIGWSQVPLQPLLSVVAPPIIALAATLAEAVTGKGLDNLTVPLIVVFTWHVLLS